ncbi:MAG TPA: hypothetical protein VM802_06125 [Chitinophaga sp.]|uniref:hypothetical protein n=1 Tax=Chitinophaga sp. TaxID=1869181 RepID=UPI002CA9C7E5|nr:hypothetical protein [Chitinophaga sp.]HVI44423.1 hypothetical protein [Chitinophaga sp.]
MHLFIKRITLFFFVAVVVVSCRKGDLPEEHYFGKVNVSLLNLPNTPKVMIYFDNKQLDTISTVGTGSHFVLQAGIKAKLAAYDAVKNELLADTLITILPNAAQDFKFAYSQELGLKGFVSGEGTKVAPDSLFVQLSNKLSATFYPKDKYDLKFIYSDPATGELVESPIVLKGWERGKLSSQILKFRVQDESGNGITYAAKIIDPATGEVVPQPDGSEFFVLGIDQSYAGKYLITSVSDDNNGSITNINSVEL